MLEEKLAFRVILLDFFDIKVFQLSSCPLHAILTHGLETGAQRGSFGEASQIGQLVQAIEAVPIYQID